MKALYEQELFKELSYHLDAYKQYIKKNENSLTDYQNLRTINYIKYLNKIFRLKERPDRNELFILKKELEESTYTMERLWMLEKIEVILS